MHRTRLVAALVVAALTLGLGAIAVATTKPGFTAARRARATLREIGGHQLGRVHLRQRGDVVTVSARARDLPPGFHGFHVHEVGRCDAPDFTSAGGHLKVGGETHGDHAGDLPSLLVLENGQTRLTTRTDRFTIGDLLAGDGAAVIVHSDRDNFANIPERYGGPDARTLETGDSGDRIACGVVR